MVKRRCIWCFPAKNIPQCGFAQLRHVFQTFSWTKAHLKPLAAAALATHVAPFAAGLAANAALRTVLPDTAIGHAIEGGAGILLFAPFLLAGHGMAAAAYRRMRPKAAARPAVAG